jgi:hypothetical protein
VSAPVTAALTEAAWHDRVLRPLVDEAADAFVDLGFLAPDGMLDLPLPHRPGRVIRLEAAGDGPLRLQSVALDGADAADVADRVDVRASGWTDETARAFDRARLFDLDRPSGTLVDVAPDGDRRAWLELRPAKDLVVDRIRVRNAADAPSEGIDVVLRGRFRRTTVYDARRQRRAWRQRMAAARATAADVETRLGLLETLDRTVRGEYQRAHRKLARVPDDDGRRILRDALNERLLPARGLEWTAHGPQRPFRRWTEAERVDYVREGALVIDALRTLTPDVCLGFGSVLAVVRDHALIPHDDDLDIIIAFEPTVATTLSDALQVVERHLGGQGFDVSGTFATHRHVRRPGRKHVDVFVGIFEGDSISWYPGPRDVLTREMVFPPASAELLGVPCTIPARPEAYLEAMYGPGWRVPDPHFNHAWNITTYADLTGDSASAANAASKSAD